MGLIKATLGATKGVLADQWREYFYCDALPNNVLVSKGRKRISNRSSNVNGSYDIISNGSVIAVADGQCMMIVEQGKVVEICAEPGEYIYDSSTEPTIFFGGLDKTSILSTFKNIGKRITFGGEAPKDQRVYYFNMKEFTGNKYGTPAPVPFRIVDKNIGLDMDITIRCFGEYSYRITNPLLFYINVCGNVETTYDRRQIDEQLKSELLTSLQPAFANISKMGIRYSALPSHTKELSESLNEILSEKWKNLRGLEIVSLGISSIKASETDEAMIKELQRNAAFKNPTMAAAQLVGAQSVAMQEAAKNQNAGSVMAFMGMNMANKISGANVQDLFQMGKSTDEAQRNVQDKIDSWTCSCGNIASGKFCSNCGAKKPDMQSELWLCTCGAKNKGNFCSNCGAPKTRITTKIRCANCGWEPIDLTKEPKFCPECGAPFKKGN